MIILVEGADGSGKSELIKNFINRYNFKELDLVPKNWPFQYNFYREFFDKIIYEYNENVIIDRSFISEMVYRIVKKDRAANITLGEINRLLTQYPIKVIYCKTDSAFKDAMARGENYITTSEEHEYLTCVYDIIIDLIRQFANVEVIDYNWKTDNIEKLNGLMT